MEITLSTPLIDADRPVGFVSGFIANRERNGVEEILVGQAELPYTEWRWPLALLTLIGEERDGAVYLDPGVTDSALLDESPAAAGEPGSEPRGAQQGVAIALAHSPASVRRQWSARAPTEAPIVALGTGVFDRMGQKVGTLRHMAVDSSSGRALRLTLSTGPAFLDHSDLPGCWIDELSARGIILKFSLGEMASLAVCVSD